MPPVHPLISIGFDLPLLFTRAALLRSAGYAVVTASPDTPSLGLLLRRQPPLVIICHTVKRRALAEVLRKIQAAQAPVLVLDPARVGPRELLATVAAAIASSVPAPARGHATGARLAVQA